MILECLKPRKDLTHAEQLGFMIQLRQLLEEGAEYVHLQFKGGDLRSFTQADLPSIRQKILYSM
jgi:hypothetical protein